jgi:NAD(P)-dependent dehydrogenase (short-subunit alcohol dehydrogenase family)
MSGRLDDRVAIVTGAGQGVGRGIALAFAREGARVVVAEFDPERGKAVAAEIDALGRPALFVQCDVTSRSSVDAAVAAAVETFGGIDVLVNNAQRAPAAPLPLMEHTEQTLDLCFDTGFRGTFHFMQACYPHLVQSGGRVINVGSGAGIDGLAGQAAYGAAKEAIRALSKTAAREWGPDGINVNVICPLARPGDGEADDGRQPDRAHRRLRDGHRPGRRLPRQRRRALRHGSHAAGRRWQRDPSLTRAREDP